MVGMAGGRWLLLMVLLCGAVWAQPVPAAPQAGSPGAPPMEMTVPSDGQGLMTLHAYSNLIQMPVLVLGPGKQPMPPIKPEKFSLSIDHGPSYKPTHVRLEGADPISLTIVLDFPGKAAELMPKIAEAIGKLAPQGLTERDHVSVFAMQCSLYDMMRDVPMQPGLLQRKLVEATAQWAQRIHTKPVPPCEEKLHLWDTMGIATLRLGELPGRRVILVVTDGEDRGSKNSAQDLAMAMQQRAVTVFGLRPLEPRAGQVRPDYISSDRRPTLAFQTSSSVTTDEPLERLCELTGGIALPANTWDAGKQLLRIPELVRGRYILEFPRPWNSTAGFHLIEVQEGSADFIRSSGIMIPLPNPETLADPTTLPNDPTLTPQIGRKPKVPPPQ
jgi:hypothetical protein